MRITSKRHLRRNKGRLRARSEGPGYRITYPDRGNGRVVKYFAKWKYDISQVNFEAVHSVSFV